MGEGDTHSRYCCVLSILHNLLIHVSNPRKESTVRAKLLYWEGYRLQYDRGTWTLSKNGRLWFQAANTKEIETMCRALKCEEIDLSYLVDLS